MSQLTPLTPATFASFVRANLYAVIHFWAVWNAHDRVMDNLLAQQMPEDLRELVAFASFDVDPPEHHDLCHLHTVLNVPFLAFYRDGLLIRSVTGLRKPEVIVEYLRALCGRTEK